MERKRYTRSDQKVVGIHGRKRVYFSYDAPENGNITDAFCLVNGKRVNLVKLGDDWFPVRGGDMEVKTA